MAGCDVIDNVVFGAIFIIYGVQDVNASSQIAIKYRCFDRVKRLREQHSD